MERKIICMGVISMLLLLGVTSFSVVATDPSGVANQQPNLQIQILRPKPIFSKTPDAISPQIIKVPSGSRFCVRVTAAGAADSTAQDKPVYRAEVKMTPLRVVPTLFSFASKGVYYTDIDGVAWIKAPVVWRDSQYKITASKKGYTSAEAYITVTPRLAIISP